MVKILKKKSPRVECRYFTGGHGLSKLEYHEPFVECVCGFLSLLTKWVTTYMPLDLSHIVHADVTAGNACSNLHGWSQSSLIPRLALPQREPGNEARWSLDSRLSFQRDPGVPGIAELSLRLSVLVQHTCMGKYCSIYITILYISTQGISL